MPKGNLLSLKKCFRILKLLLMLQTFCKDLTDVCFGQSGSFIFQILQTILSLGVYRSLIFF